MPPRARPGTSQRGARPSAAVLLLALATLAAACGQLGQVHRPAATGPDYLAARVATGGSYPDNGEGAIKGGVERIPVTSRPAARPPVVIDPGEVFRGRSVIRLAPPTVGPDGELVVTFPQWAALLLPRLDAPVCGNNLVAVVAWEAQEGTAARWNPLATTRAMPGASVFNSHGVKNYRSLEQGLQATVLTLDDGLDVYGYRPVVDLLRACAPPLQTAQALQASDWCRDCANGRYATALVPALIEDFNRAFAGA